MVETGKTTWEHGHQFTGKRNMCCLFGLSTALGLARQQIPVPVELTIS
jgi:hypothetical protein